MYVDLAVRNISFCKSCLCISRGIGSLIKSEVNYYAFLRYLFNDVYLLFLYTSLPKTLYRSVMIDFSAINISKSSMSNCFDSGVRYSFLRCFKSSTLCTPRIFFSLIKSLCFCWLFLVNKHRCTPGV